MNLRLLFLAGLLFSATWALPSAFGAQAHSIDGVWRLPQDGTLIKIISRNGKAEGFIFHRPHDRSDEIDKFNPKKEMRSQPIIGLRVLKDLSLRDDGQWTGGTVYDPDSGSTYSARAHLSHEGTLVMRGYILIPLLGRSVILTRAD